MAQMSDDSRCDCWSWFWGPWSRAGAMAALLTFLVDQAHKWWMILGVGMKPGDRFEVLPFFDMIFVKNTGISYSMFDSATFEWQLALAVFAAIAAVLLWIWLARWARSRVLAISLGLIIGGALGNGLDRLVHGGVADFFLFHAFGRSWYVFNVADIAIVAGVGGLLYDSIVLSRNAASN